MLATVMGCGPAGLIAAHAVAEAGHSVTIVSRRRKSEMFGAQYLHAPIPGLDLPDPITVKYELQGTTEQYREKVYGPGWKGSVSPEDLLGEHMGWDIRAAYDQLWRKFNKHIIEFEFDSDDPWSVKRLIDNSDLVISSVPRDQLCINDLCNFTYESVWAAGDAPERGVFSPVVAPDDTVVCNGLPDVGWYRASTVFGYSTVEWPWNRKPPVPVSQVVKPLQTNCSCWPEIKYVGRYGRWEKGVLSHQSFNDALQYLHVPVQGALF